MTFTETLLFLFDMPILRVGLFIALVYSAFVGLDYVMRKLTKIRITPGEFVLGGLIFWIIFTNFDSFVAVLRYSLLWWWLLY